MRILALYFYSYDSDFTITIEFSNVMCSRVRLCCRGRKSRVSAVALRCVNVNANEPQQPQPQAGDATATPAAPPAPQQQQQQEAQGQGQGQGQYSLLVGTEAGELASVEVLVGAGSAEDPRLELGAFVVRAAEALSKCAALQLQLCSIQHFPNSHN